MTPPSSIQGLGQLKWAFKGKVQANTSIHGPPLPYYLSTFYPFPVVMVQQMTVKPL